MRAAKFSQEVVEDSELERELIRQHRRFEKKRKAEAAAQETVRQLPIVTISDDSEPSSPVASVASHLLSVIEITTGSSKTRSSQSDPEPTTKSGALRATSVIDITSDSSGAPSPAVSVPSSPKNVVNRAILFNPVLDHSPLLVDSLQNPIPKTVSDDPVDEDGDKPVKFNFNKFAFKETRPSAKTQPIPCLSRTPSELQDCRPAKAAKMRPSVFLDTISDIQLSKLGKCVSCDVKWTTRKGAGPKRTHMKSCARKHSFTDETVLVLVLRELENALLVNNGEEKAQTAIPETIFEKTIHDAFPKKRVRRKEVIETVKDPLDRRESIMARAQTVLFSARSLSIDQETSMEFLPTQAFGKSALMQRQSSRIKMFYEESTDSGPHIGEEILSYIQPLAPLRLGTTGSDSQNTNVHVLAESDIHNQPAENPTPSNPPLYAVCCSTSSDPYSTLISAENNEISPPPAADGVDLDVEVEGGACLHYEPSVDKAIYPQLPENHENKMNKQDKHIQKRTRNYKSKCNEESTEEFNAEWEQAVRHKILQDQVLHQRILRYEPIHFNVFLEMVTSGSNASGRLRSQLRLLLDKLAINFYGADPVVRRKH